jgi:hypothetical protein
VKSSANPLWTCGNTMLISRACSAPAGPGCSTHTITSFVMPPSGAPDPLDDLPDLPRRAPLHIRVRSLNLSFSANWSPDSNSTTTGLPGPGLVIGRLFSAGGRRLETIVNRTAAVAGLGYEGIARRLLVLMRGRHARCAPWVDFSSAPVLDLAIELGSGFCEACIETYFDSRDKRIGRLVARLLPAIQ